jgi:hypothetical protein
LILFGEGSIRRAAAEFTAHYNVERNHQGVENKLICPDPTHVREGEGEATRASGGTAELLLQNRRMTRQIVNGHGDIRSGAPAECAQRDIVVFSA